MWFLFIIINFLLILVVIFLWRNDNNEITERGHTHTMRKLYLLGPSTFTESIREKFTKLFIWVPSPQRENYRNFETDKWKSSFALVWNKWSRRWENQSLIVKWRHLESVSRMFMETRSNRKVDCGKHTKNTLRASPFYAIELFLLFEWNESGRSEVGMALRAKRRS